MANEEEKKREEQPDERWAREEGHARRAREAERTADIEKMVYTAAYLTALHALAPIHVRAKTVDGMAHEHAEAALVRFRDRFDVTQGQPPATVPGDDQ